MLTSTAEEKYEFMMNQEAYIKNPQHEVMSTRR